MTLLVDCLEPLVEFLLKLDIELEGCKTLLFLGFERDTGTTFGLEFAFWGGLGLFLERALLFFSAMFPFTLMLIREEILGCHF